MSGSRLLPRFSPYHSVSCEWFSLVTILTPNPFPPMSNAERIAPRRARLPSRETPNRSHGAVVRVGLKPRSHPDPLRPRLLRHRSLLAAPALLCRLSMPEAGAWLSRSGPAPTAPGSEGGVLKKSSHRHINDECDGVVRF